MIQLPEGFSAIQWTGQLVLIRTLPWILRVNKIYARNPVTGTGYIGYDRNDLYPSLTAFVPGIDYLVDMLSGYLLPEAVTAPAGVFSAFPGYVPVAVAVPDPASSTPTPIPGTVNTGTAASIIIGGTLVARVEAGIVPYSTTTLDLRYLIFGFALNSSLAGGVVQVQRSGVVQYPGLGLEPNRTLLAGANGRIVYTSEGMAVHHVIGRSLSDDTFVYSSSYTTYAL